MLIKTLYLPWQEIDTVMLDMDGTLLDLHFDWYFWMTYLPKKYAKKNNINITKAKKIIHKKIQSQAGTLNWYCIDYWSEQLDLPITELKHDLKHLIKPHPQVNNFLQTLKSLNKQIIMVTNAHRDSLEIKMQVTNIEQYFCHIISSHDYGKPKEDIQIWEDIMQDIPYNPARTLLIDDNINALTAAKKFGIKHCLAAIFVSKKMAKIDPQTFPSFEKFSQIMPYH
jgi:putative hydrolase of the HAD superfamily